MFHAAHHLQCSHRAQLPMPPHLNSEHCGSGGIYKHRHMLRAHAGRAVGIEPHSGIYKCHSETVHTPMPKLCGSGGICKRHLGARLPVALPA